MTEYEQKIADVIREVGIFGLKTLIILNSGAAVVLLAFVGNLFGAGELTIDVALIKAAMVLFLFGLLGAMGSVLATYIFAQMAGSSTLSETAEKRGVFFMVAPAVLAFLAFAAGFLTAVAAIG